MKPRHASNHKIYQSNHDEWKASYSVIKANYIQCVEMFVQTEGLHQERQGIQIEDAIDSFVGSFNILVATISDKSTSCEGECLTADHLSIQNKPHCCTAGQLEVEKDDG